MAVLAGAAVSCGPKEETVAGPAFDPEAHMFLEEVEGTEAIDWVKKQNERSLAVLQGDARYQAYYDEALKIATSKARIPYGSIRAGHVYNFWQDDEHERGLWRRVVLGGYASEAPKWETLLDIDELAKAESANWVYKGVDCLPPRYEDCLVELSDGGKDAVRIREFDTSLQNGGPKGFVGGGFDIPEAKTTLAWQDKDTLLVATDWGEGSLTESGYPFIVKRLYRGQKLADAVEVFRGTRENVGAFPMVIEDAAGKRYLGAAQSETFFTSSFYYFPETGSAPLKFPIPPKSTPQGVFADTLLVTLEQDWTPASEGGVGQDAFKTGDLIGFKWSSFIADGKLPKVELVFRPTEKQAIQGVALSKGAVLLSISDNVVLKVLAYTRANTSEGGAGWKSKDIPLPEKGSAGVSYANISEQVALLGFEGFLQPDALYQYDTVAGTLKQIKSMPTWFDASAYQVDQNEATSKDGTKIPYFVVHKKDLKLDGSNPTLLAGYGGFQVSETPAYSGTVGKLWLEQGGVYVLANIRGGGEFGPAWHQAGLKTKRQVIYDDFIAVAEDLIAKKITSKEKLGAIGGSNGGLLVGVMFTQRPDLFKAIVCQVPLLDMLRYHKLLAGASWMDEYGDPDVAEERAFLEKLSPYHNLKADAAYPEIYFETSTKDDRVHPSHARKMAKRLEEMGKPFLYYENIDGGHSAAANQREAARRAALEYTYLARKLIDGQ